MRRSEKITMMKEDAVGSGGVLIIILAVENVDLLLFIRLCMYPTWGFKIKSETIEIVYMLRFSLSWA